MAAEAGALMGADRREPVAGGGAALGAVGIASVSAATTLAAALEPPPGGLFTDTFYRLALFGTFLGGVALVGASVWVADNPAARRAAGNKLLYTAVPPLLAALGLSVAALLWGMLSCKKTRCICSDFRGMYNLTKTSKRNAS